MVLKGQFLERATVVPLNTGEVLEAVSHRGQRLPHVLIVPPPPSEGSGMDNVLAAELAYGAASGGFPTLRFNFRGIGASQGQRSVDANAWLEDVSAAFDACVDNVNTEQVAVFALGASDLLLSAVSKRKVLSGAAFVNPSLLSLPDLRALPERLPLLLLLASSERPQYQSCVDWLTEREHSVDIVNTPDRTFQRGLTEVSKSAQRWLSRLS
jgi:uncharacterized protein